METNKLIAGIVAAAIAVIVLAGVLMPALSNATTTEDKFTNDGGFYFMEKITDETDYRFIWDHTKPTIATVNGEEVTLEKGTTVISNGGTFLIRYGQDGTGYYLQSVPGSTLNVIAYSAGTNAADLDITVSSGTISVKKTLVSDSSVTTVTSTCDNGFGVAASGNYVLKKPTQTAYMNGDSEIYAMGLTTIGGVWSNGFYLHGNIDDGVTVQLYTANEGDYTITDEVIVYDEISNYIDLYGFDAVTFTATIIANSASADCTYSYVIVPYEVTAERSVHLTDAMNVILNVIPLLVIVAVLLGVVAVFILRRE